MSTDEKIRELAEILEGVFSSLISVAPHNHVQHLEFLRQRAEALVNSEFGRRMRVGGGRGV